MKLSVSQLMIIVVVCILAAIIIIILNRPQPTVIAPETETQVEQQIVTPPELGKYELPPKQEMPQQKISEQKNQMPNTSNAAAQYGTPSKPGKYLTPEQLRDLQSKGVIMN